jgi:hypothetical protein
MELVSCLSKLKEAVNRLRAMKHQLGEVAGRTAKSRGAVRSRAKALIERLSAIESIMVDPKRKSARDVLRNPAGLNDTLLDMIAMTTIADAAPTTQTRAVSKETMAKVDAQIAKLDALVAGDIARLNKELAKARTGYVAAA